MTRSAVETDPGGAGFWTRLASRGLDWIGRKLLGEPARGSVTFILPDGRSRTLGRPGDGGEHATFRMNNFGVVPKAMRRGTVGFAAAYLDGDFDCDDLTALMRFFVQNAESFRGKGLFRRAAQDFFAHAARPNTREGARQNIAEHYDLGNDFYGMWLDPSMTYSSAVFSSGDQSLEAAQLAKYHRVADMAGVKAGDRVLEIGCGWGGFAETVARDYRAELHGITLSREQLKFALDRLRRQGLDSFAKLHFEDYRDTTGTFDRVCSIEMIEAVGEEHWPDYFRTIRDRLRPGGKAAIQAITILEEGFDDYRSAPDFIQLYIFPGGMLMTKAAMREQGEKAGLVLESVDTFGQSYARTLRLWRERFLERWPMIEALGYDERFKRKWLYYLSYCEAGFAEGLIDVGIYQYGRPE